MVSRAFSSSRTKSSISDRDLVGPTSELYPKVEILTFACGTKSGRRSRNQIISPLFQVSIGCPLRPCRATTLIDVRPSIFARATYSSFKAFSNSCSSEKSFSKMSPFARGASVIEAELPGADSVAVLGYSSHESMRKLVIANGCMHTLEAF
jgi:hypothetical protein